MPQEGDPERGSPTPPALTPERRRQIESLVHAALERRPDERTAFVAEACGSDPELRREVESLLGYEGLGEERLGKPAWERVARLLETRASAPRPLPPGTQLGPYRILEAIGAGGMGQVYRARDERLNRIVALKTLPPDRLADPERRQRFLQEARAASALNHPNIVTFFDLAAAGGCEFLVMEHVAGKTLDRVIPKRGLPLREALRYALQMADALAAAHAAGVVHRDLKPGNIMITEAGVVKLLDFGLAKLAHPSESEGTPESVTQPGMVLGTAAYMSPEQAEGKKLDARSDIFSFGSVLYEMLTGRRPFRGDSTLSTLAAIVQKEPAPLPAEIPHELAKLVTRCLRKDPARRFQHMDDVKVALEELKEESDSGKLVAPAAGRRKRQSAWLAIAAGTVLLAAAVGVTWWLTRASKLLPAPVLTRLTSDSGLTTDPALSPDGKLLAYASDRAGEGNLDIWVQQVGGGEPIRLTRDPADDYEPAFSPDGTKIVFRSERAGGGSYVVSALGGEERLVAPGGRRPQFSPDGRQIVYWAGDPSGARYSRGAAKIYIASLSGGPPRQLEPKFEVAFSPTWAADGKHVIFGGLLTGGRLESQMPREMDFWVASLDGAPAVKTGVTGVLAKQELIPIPLYPHLCVAGGNRFVISARSGDSVNLWEIAFSPQTWQAEGPAQRLTFGSAQEVQPSAGANRLAFASLTERSNIWSLPIEANQGKSAGALQQITRGAVNDLVPAVAANGKKLVFLSNRSGTLQVWVQDLETGRETAVAASPQRLHRTIIAPDGSKVAYRERVGQEWTTYVVSSSGGVAEKVCEDCLTLFDWSADGRKILLSQAGNKAVGLLDLASGEKVELFRHPEYSLWQAEFSPDGRWISFLVFDSAHGPYSRLYVVPFRPRVAIPLAEWIPITDGQFVDDKPRWSPDGNLMYFTSERDGFRCIWAQPLDPVTKRPIKSAFAVYHSHSSQRSLMNLERHPLEMSVTRNALIFNLGERSGNIWMAEWKQRR